MNSGVMQKEGNFATNSISKKASSSIWKVMRVRLRVLNNGNFKQKHEKVFADGEGMMAV